MNFKFLPNLITLFNLFLGCIVTLLLIENNLEVKYVFIITVICLILDYLDGYIARKLNAKSDIGIQLDSLADMVSFGLVPGILLYNMFNAAPLPSCSHKYINVLEKKSPGTFSIKYRNLFLKDFIKIAYL